MDNAITLMLLSTALKDLAVELNIFVMTATQLNAEAEEKKGIKNQSCIRGRCVNWASKYLIQLSLGLIILD